MYKLGKWLMPARDANRVTILTHPLYHIELIDNGYNGLDIRDGYQAWANQVIVKPTLSSLNFAFQTT